MNSPELWPAHACRAYVRSNVPRLREILTDPVYRAAVCCLHSQAQPSLRHKVPVEWLAGFADFDREMRKLVENPPVTEDLDPWSHIDDE